MLSPDAEQALRDKLIAFERERGSQIAVITVPSTQPEPISDFTNRVGDAWKIGRRDVGDGVLIAVAPQDRKVWISVARALEGAIPDVTATRITRELMGPAFARGDFAGGINAGVDAVMKRIEGEALPTPAGIPRHKVDAGKDLLGALVPLIIFGTIVAGLLRRLFGTPGAAMTSMGVGAIVGFLLTSLVIGVVAAVAVFLFSAFMGGGGGGRTLGGRRGGPVILPGGWSGGGGLGRRWRRRRLELRWRRRLRRRRWRQQLVAQDGHRTHAATLGHDTRRGPSRLSGGRAAEDPAGDRRERSHAQRRDPLRGRSGPADELPASRRAGTRTRADDVREAARLGHRAQQRRADLRGSGRSPDRDRCRSRPGAARRPPRSGTAIAAAMRDAFRARSFEAGAIAAVQAVGALLARHFPLAAGERNPNELPDDPTVL